MTRTEPWCASCACSLTSHAHGDAVVWRCPGCRGVFLPQAQEDDMQLATRGRGARAVHRDAVTCPWCSHGMGRDHVDGVELDRCLTCGIWLDDGELERLLGQPEPTPRVDLTPTMRPKRRIGGSDVFFFLRGGLFTKLAIYNSIEDDYRRQQREATKEAALLAWAAQHRDAA